MTPEEHNKFVGLAHLGYGVFSMLLWLGLSLFYVLVFGVAFLVDPKMNNDPIPLFVIAFLVAFVFFFVSLFSLPSIIAGYGHLKKKSWAKIWSLIAAFLGASNFPLGTAVAVYSIWFHFGESGKEFYKQEEKRSQFKTQPQLNPQTANWSTNKTEEFTEKDFVNLSQPPNWRDD